MAKDGFVTAKMDSDSGLEAVEVRATVNTYRVLHILPKYFDIMLTFEYLRPPPRDHN